MFSPVRSLSAAAMCAAVLTLAGAAGAPSSEMVSAGMVTATPGVAEPRSGRVVIATPQGQVSAYVVNARTPQRVRAVRRAIRGANGRVVQAWPQIGVFVVHSRSAAFRADVRRVAGPRLASVGATRTVGVQEELPSTGGTQAVTRDDPGSPDVAEPREGEQWGMAAIRADRAHTVNGGSSSVVVGVLDSGIDPDHPDLAANLLPSQSVDCTGAGVPDTATGGWHPTGSDHGTHVAGIIAAARNGIGVVGVAPNARLASIKVVNDEGLIYPEYAVCGFMWAGLQEMAVSNSSFYVDPFAYYCSDQPDQRAALEAVRRAVRWSTAQGVVHAAAAGNAAVDLAHKTVDLSSPNDGTPVGRRLNSGCLDIPAELPGVVTVSAYGRSGLASFSNRGLGVIDVAAPGVGILSTVVEGNGWALKDGTSMATPHVSGVLALLASAHPTWSPAQLRSALGAQAVDQPCRPPEGEGRECEGTLAENSYAGEGLVDALAAVTS